MTENFVSVRNQINAGFYKQILKRIFFQLDPETIHDRMVFAGRILGSNAVSRRLTALGFSYSEPRLQQDVLGIKFPNPVGLAAGFDKDAQLVDILPSVGFGFAEVGSITGEPCEGNPKPRLWRLKKSKGLVVYYGLKNEGCQKIAARLKNRKFQIPIGTSIAKTNCPETADARRGIEDYAKAFSEFTKIGQYFTLNISCPNAYGGQPFTDAVSLDQLLERIDQIPTKKPILLKISPDLSKSEVDAILDVVSNHRVHGFVCTNLTKDRGSKKIVERTVPEKGGISGKVVEDLATEIIRYIYKKTKDKYVIIGCGGVFSAEDAYKKIKAGASLIQLITGMVFEGPQLISEINLGLVELLKRDNLSNISQAVGREF